jgi:ribosomal protein S14
VAHANACLNLYGRRLLVERVITDGRPVAHVAKELGISRQCAHRWVGSLRKPRGSLVSRIGLHGHTGVPAAPQSSRNRCCICGLLRARPSRVAAPSGRQEDRPYPRRWRLESPRPCHGRHWGAETSPDRVRLRALAGRRPHPTGLLRDPARRARRPGYAPTTLDADTQPSEGNPDQPTVMNARRAQQGLHNGRGGPHPDREATPRRALHQAVPRSSG